jgi:hypothetical protein
MEQALCWTLCQTYLYLKSVSSPEPAEFSRHTVPVRRKLSINVVQRVEVLLQSNLGVNKVRNALNKVL